MNKTKSQLILLFSCIALTIYFLVRFYLMGYSMDTLEATKETQVLDTVILIGIAAGILGIIITLIKKVPTPIKVIVFVLNILICITSIIVTPDWDALEEKQAQKYLQKETEKNLTDE